MALVDEISEIQELILIRSEERKFFLKKLCQLEPQVEIEVQRIISQNFPQPTNTVSNTTNKKGKTRPNNDTNGLFSREILCILFCLK